MALLPSWGVLVRDGFINMDNVEAYADFLTKRYCSYKNIIWLLGGDMKADHHMKIYHKFGRCSSSLWFNDAEWLDFHMFQSVHRRYDQCCMGRGMIPATVWHCSEKITGNM